MIKEAGPPCISQPFNLPCLTLLSQPKVVNRLILRGEFDPELGRAMACTGQQCMPHPGNVETSETNTGGPNETFWGQRQCRDRGYVER